MAALVLCVLRHQVGKLRQTRRRTVYVCKALTSLPGRPAAGALLVALLVRRRRHQINGRCMRPGSSTTAGGAAWR